MRLIDSLADISGEYDAILCDIWGVIHDGVRVLPEVPEALRGARARGIPVVLMSNVPRTSATIPAAVGRLGLPTDAYDAVVTSGDTTRPELARRSPGPVHRLGRDTDASLWEGLGLEFGSLGAASFLAIAGLRPGEHPDDYLPTLRKAAVRGLDLVCANPDIQVWDGTGLAWTAGSVAQRYAALGGRVISTGKPDAAIYRRAREVVERIARRPVPPARVLAIGDGLGTDVRGANRAGLTCLFVATGLNSDRLLGVDGRADRGRVEAALAEAGATAQYAITHLA